MAVDARRPSTAEAARLPARAGSAGGRATVRPWPRHARSRPCRSTKAAPVGPLVELSADHRRARRREGAPLDLLRHGRARTPGRRPRRPSHMKGCVLGSWRPGDGGAEVGLHGSYRRPTTPPDLREKERSRCSPAPSGGSATTSPPRPAPEPRPLEPAGFAYDSSLGFSDALGFRAGIAHPFRPWDFEPEAPRTSSRCRSRPWTSRSRRSATSGLAPGQRTSVSCASRLGRGERRRLRRALALRAVRLGAAARLGSVVQAVHRRGATAGRRLPAGRGLAEEAREWLS